MPTRLSGIQQLAPIPTANLHQQVYHQLRQAIMTGKFRPGEVLTLRGLAAAMGTSIMPARDAVLRLAVERALESFSRGVRIPSIDLDQLDDVVRLRLVVEGEAASLAARRATAADLALIKQTCADAENALASQTISQFLVAEQAFHFSVYRAAHSQILQTVIETLWLQTGPVLALLIESEEGQTMSGVELVAHHRLIEAIQNRDGDAARSALTQDITDGSVICRRMVEAAWRKAGATQ